MLFNAWNNIIGVRLVLELSRNQRDWEVLSTDIFEKASALLCTKETGLRDTLRAPFPNIGVRAVMEISVLVIMLRPKASTWTYLAVQALDSSRYMEKYCLTHIEPTAVQCPGSLSLYALLATDDFAVLTMQTFKKDLSNTTLHRDVHCFPAGWMLVLKTQ